MSVTCVLRLASPAASQPPHSWLDAAIVVLLTRCTRGKSRADAILNFPAVHLTFPANFLNLLPMLSSSSGSIRICNFLWSCWPTSAAVFGGFRPLVFWRRQDVPGPSARTAGCLKRLLAGKVMELHVGQTVYAVRRTDCRCRRRKLALMAGGTGGRHRWVDVQAAGGRRRILRRTVMMGGRWKNFNFKIVGNRCFLLAMVARLRVEFSALLHGQKSIQVVFLHAQRIKHNFRDLHWEQGQQKNKIWSS